MPNPRPTTPARDRAARLDGIRTHNLSLVLRQVLEAPAPPSRADISARTGLTRATVSALVDRLVQARMVTPLAPVLTRRAGRPGAPLVPASGSFAAIGLEVNVSYLGARAIDLAGNVLANECRPGDFQQSDPGAVLDQLAGLTNAVVEQLAASKVQIVGAELALPGLVDRTAGVLRTAPNLGWRDVTLADVLSHPPFDTFALLELGNEASLAARAAAASHPDSHASFVYVSGEVGIGAGLVHEGVVFEGRRGWGGEIGHNAIEPYGPPCRCGARGCLEQYAGRSALMTAAGLDPTAPVQTLREHLDRGDTRARSAVDRAGWALGVALANVVNLLDVEEVVLGGGFAPLAVELIPAITTELDSRVLSAPWSRPFVRAVEDGQHAAMTGAARSILHALISDPAAWGARAAH